MDKDVAGLQFLRDGTWYNVPTVSNYTLLINVGVTMEIMTNGIFKGPVHRVVTNSEKERISVAVFYVLDPENAIWLITQMLNEDQQAR
uniref:Isopenicillin N synthase-like Fe(2+) 2OG dioxygenase domain-containing protein n=1 Tax=Triticum urartu TaxID=4572 RepID=A0A8R7Q976_TRIUA